MCASPPFSLVQVKRSWSRFTVSLRVPMPSWNLSLNLSMVVNLMPLHNGARHFTWRQFSPLPKLHMSRRITFVTLAGLVPGLAALWFSNQFDKSSQNSKTVSEQIIAWHSALAGKIWLKTDVKLCSFWVYRETLCSVAYDIMLRCQ